MTTIQSTRAGYDMDIISTKDGKDLSITFIKHGSLLFTYDNKNIYLDPVLEYADYTQLPKADLVLITHEHYDHFDTKVFEVIENETTQFIENRRVKEMFCKGRMLLNGDKITLWNTVHIEATPAYNLSEERQQFHPHNGRDNGYILTFGGTNVYISGDTENIPEMKNLKDIDIAFLAMNQPYTMTVEQAVIAANDIKPKVVYPYHYSDTPLQEYADAMKNTGIEVRIRKL